MEETDQLRDWGSLPGQVLQHVVQDDTTTALRRSARAVCPPWRASVNAHVQQAYCDVSDVPLLRSFTDLKAVVIDEVDLMGRLQRQRQQRLWALPKQHQPQTSQPFIALDTLQRPPSPTDNNSRSSEHGTSRRRRQLDRTPLAQHLADLGRLEIFQPPHLDVSILRQLPRLQDVTLRCTHLLGRSLPVHTPHLVNVTSLTLQQLNPFGCHRVDFIPISLMPLRSLRRLAFIGMRHASAAQLLQPLTHVKEEERARLHTVWQKMQKEFPCSTLHNNADGQEQQQQQQQGADGQQQQQQQQGKDEGGQQAAGAPQDPHRAPDELWLQMTQMMHNLNLGPEPAATASSSSSKGTSGRRGLQQGSSSGGSSGGFATGGSSSICSVLPANALLAEASSGAREGCVSSAAAAGSAGVGVAGASLNGQGGSSSGSGSSLAQVASPGALPKPAAATAAGTGGAESAAAGAATEGALASAAVAGPAEVAGTLPSSSSGGDAPSVSPLPCPWLGNLHCLVLRGCSLNVLPPEALASLGALTSLDLSNNYLELLPSGLGGLRRLQVLILDNNNYMRRAHKPPWPGLTALTHLSLSSCSNLWGRRLALSQLVGLQRLGAADNDSAPVGRALEGCNTLKVLDVRGTRIGRSLSTALIHQLPALQRCMYGYRGGGKWVAAVRKAVPPGRLELLKDSGWLATYDAQEDQDFLYAKDWVDAEASSSSGGSEEEDEDDSGSSSGGGSSGSEEDGGAGSDDDALDLSSGGSDTESTQTDPSTESAATHASEDSDLVPELEEEGEDSGSWEEADD